MHAFLRLFFNSFSFLPPNAPRPPPFPFPFPFPFPYFSFYPFKLSPLFLSTQFPTPFFMWGFPQRADPLTSFSFSTIISFPRSIPSSASILQDLLSFFSGHHNSYRINIEG